MMHTLRSISICVLGGLLAIALPRPAAAAPFAYIPNSNSDTVSVVDVATNSVVATIAVGRAPYAVAANPYGSRVYVLNALDNTVSVVDAGTHAVSSTVSVGQLGDKASGLAINPQGTRVYVANAQDNAVSVIDTSTDTVVGAPIAVGAYPRGVAVSPTESRVYVSNNGSGSLSIIDTTTNVEIAALTVGDDPRAVAVHPSGSPVYVAYSGGVAMVDPATMTVTTALAGLSVSGVAVSPDGASVYVTSGDTNSLSVIDAHTGLPVGSPIAVGLQPEGVSVTSDGARIYVTNVGSDTVSAVDASTRAVVAAVNVQSRPAAIGSFINDVPPVASDRAVSTPQNVAVAVDLTASDLDNDPLTFGVIAGPAHGTLGGTAPHLTYTPATNYGGPDSFSFTANDGATDSNVAVVSITVPFNTSTTVTSSLTPSAYGQPVTLSATVKSGAGSAVGSVVQFFDGGTLLGTVALSGGAASLTTGDIGAGTRAITAVYQGNNSFAGSASSPWTQTVSSTALTSSLSVSYNVAYSDIVTFTATLSPSSPNRTPSSTVTFKVGSQVVATGVPFKRVDNTYQASWTGPLLEPSPYGTPPTGQMKPGIHTVTAMISSDPNYTYSNPNPARPMTIAREDARVSYKGPTAVSTHGTGTAIIPLTVSVKDITAVMGDTAYDPNGGDIRNAQVSYIDRSTNTIIATVNVMLSGIDPKEGMATYNWVVNLGSAKSKTYTVGFSVGNYYIRNNPGDDAVITVTR